MAGMISGKGVGRGAAFMVKVSGILLVVVAVSLLGMKKIKALEQGSEMQVS